MYGNAYLQFPGPVHTPGMDPRALLEWYLEAGVDEAIDEAPVNRLAPPPMVAPPFRKSAPYSGPTVPPSEAIAQARALADRCTTLDELKAAIEGFTGCALKKTAMRTVIADGNPQARVMLIGEAPGAQEDQQGIPFCGPSGKLLDKMLGSIGLTRETVYISNTVFWRPPGNRQPSAEEIAICQPFVEKHVALVGPALLLLAGSVAAGALLRQSQSIGRLRQKTYPYTNPYLQSPVEAVVLFHPSYLLRTPAQKRLAWHDMLFIRFWLEDKQLI